MEDQVDTNVENLREAMSGMMVNVSIQPDGKDLLKIGSTVLAASIIGTVGTLIGNGWWQRRKYKKTIDKLNEEIGS